MNPISPANRTITAAIAMINRSKPKIVTTIGVATNMNRNAIKHSARIGPSARSASTKTLFAAPASYCFAIHDRTIASRCDDFAALAASITAARAFACFGVAHLANFCPFNNRYAPSVPVLLISEKETNAPVGVAELEPPGNVCELNAQTPAGEIEIGNKCDTKTRPGGGNGFNINIAPFPLPSHAIGFASRQRRPVLETKATDCFFTQIKHSARYNRARISSSDSPSEIMGNTD